MSNFTGSQPRKETLYGGPTQRGGGTVYGGPSSGGTVYDPNRKVRTGGARPDVPLEKFQKGSNILFIIAGFSVLNSVLALTGVNFALAIGLGVTRAFDIGLKEGAPIGPALMVYGVVTGIFLLLGNFARSGNGAAILIGMLLYAVDTAFLFMQGRPIGVVIHAFFIFALFGAFRASRR